MTAPRKQLSIAVVVLALLALLAPATAAVAQAPFDARVNFSSPNAPIPAGFVRDHGQAYGARTGAGQGSGLSYGWVVPGTATPLNLAVGGSTPGNGRDRNVAGFAQEFDTLVHAQGNNVANFNGTPAPGSWELAVAAGTYRVEVAVGDPSNYDSAHTVNVEGQNLVHRFVPTTSTRHRTVSALVRVVDGRVTVSPVGGTNTKFAWVRVTRDTAADARPAVLSALPANQSTGLPRNEGLATTLSIVSSGGGVDPATLAANVRLVRASDGAVVPANVATSGGRDTITLQPNALLAASTTYRLEIGEGVRDLNGASFLPFASVVTTGTTGGEPTPVNARFTKVALGPSAEGRSFTSLAMGPDGKLYAATLTGEIVRYTLAANGTIAASQVLATVRDGNAGAQRMVIGLAFDPAATASNLVVWVTHSTFGFGGMADWGGKVSRLSGPNLATYTDYVVNLPRSARDHLTNSLAVRNGLLYVSQGSNSAMGAPDAAWSNRPERALSAAVLQINPAAITSPPLDVKTAEGGTYNPFAANAPVRVYGSGIRNAFDLVWHSNGSLYVPTNGSAGGGSTPGTPSPPPSACATRWNGQPYTGGAVPALANQPVTQNDFLFRVVQGGYYGHPNAARCEWVLNGGNPTAGADTAEVTAYPVPRPPDPNWRGAVYDFANNKSPNGAIEYRSNVFGGTLRGSLLVVRYSNNNDIIALRPDAAGGIAEAITGIPGLTDLADPLDLTERANGDLYVSAGVSSTSPARITLLRATP